MNTLDIIFNYYDQAIAGIPPTYQALISLVLLIFLFWQTYHVIKSGHWIFIVLLIIFLPGTWPAAKFVGNLLLSICKYLLVRIQSNL